MEIHLALIAIGGLLLLGLVADEIGRRSKLPRVTLLALFGVAAGPSGLDLLPDGFHEWYEFLATIALTMVAFLLGGTLAFKNLRRHGREILIVSLAAVVVTAVVVGLGMVLIGASAILALILAGTSTATDPAATTDVIQQTRAKGPFTSTLMGIVAVDDAWGLIAFSLVLVIAKAVAGDGATAIIGHGLWEIGGAVVVGTVVGAPAAYLTGRLGKGQPMQSEALGIVFLCAGLALWLEVSFLLSGMIAGGLVANLAHHHKRPFHAIENIEWPFMVLFFVLAGASLRFESLGEIGAIGIAYLVLRTAGRLLGGWIGGKLAQSPRPHRIWMGPALMPQAGVALGMALVASNHFPDLADTVLTVVVGTTVVFELFGPVLTQLALSRVGEAGGAETTTDKPKHHKKRRKRKKHG